MHCIVCTGQGEPGDLLETRRLPRPAQILGGCVETNSATLCTRCQLTWSVDALHGSPLVGRQQTQVRASD